MPVHAPGPRLYSAIPFKFLGGKPGGGSLDANVALNLTPFVDMMTILVTFLLMVFSASGEILMGQKGLQLPEAFNQDMLQQAPVIIITQEDITFYAAGSGQQVAQTESIVDDTSPQWKIPELFERMKTEKRLFTVKYDDLPQMEKDRCEGRAEVKPGQLCLDGLAILQADAETPAKVINRVLKTANAAGYTNIMFAVERRGGSG